MVSPHYPTNTQARDTRPVIILVATKRYDKHWVPCAQRLPSRPDTAVMDDSGSTGKDVSIGRVRDCDDILRERFEGVINRIVADKQDRALSQLPCGGSDIAG